MTAAAVWSRNDPGSQSSAEECARAGLDLARAVREHLEAVLGRGTREYRAASVAISELYCTGRADELRAMSERIAGPDPLVTTLDGILRSRLDWHHSPRQLPAGPASPSARVIQPVSTRRPIVTAERDEWGSTNVRHAVIRYRVLGLRIGRRS